MKQNDGIKYLFNKKIKDNRESRIVKGLFDEFLEDEKYLKVRCRLLKGGPGSGKSTAIYNLEESNISL